MSMHFILNSPLLSVDSSVLPQMEEGKVSDGYCYELYEHICYVYTGPDALYHYTHMNAASTHSHIHTLTSSHQIHTHIIIHAHDSELDTSILPEPVSPVRPTLPSLWRVSAVASQCVFV